MFGDFFRSWYDRYSRISDIKDVAILEETKSGVTHRFCIIANLKDDSPLPTAIEFAETREAALERMQHIMEAIADARVAPHH